MTSVLLAPRPVLVVLDAFPSERVIGELLLLDDGLAVAALELVGGVRLQLVQAALRALVTLRHCCSSPASARHSAE